MSLPSNRTHGLNSDISELLSQPKCACLVVCSGIYCKNPNNRSELQFRLLKIQIVKTSSATTFTFLPPIPGFAVSTGTCSNANKAAYYWTCDCCMRLDTTPEEGEASRTQPSLCCRVLKSLLLCTGEIKQLDVYMEGKLFGLQLVVWGLRGVAGVILANNPLSGVLILASVFWTSPWQALLGTLGTLISTLTAIIMGQDRADVSRGEHGINGMLVALMMGAYSSAGDWYWWLLLPVCMGSVACVFFHSGLSSFLNSCSVPASVFPFNIVTVLYLLCTGPNNPYYPHYRVPPPWETEPNGTGLAVVEVTHGIILGVGQIYTCGDLGPSLLILGAVLLYSPLLAFHALLGSAIGTLAGLSVAVHHDFLYTGLSGFNGALGCMEIGGRNFTFNWKTHLYAVANAFLSAYVDIALSNLLGTIGLPALSWAATLTSTLMLLQNGNLAKYRVQIK